jgi:hypothetical protein
MIVKMLYLTITHEHCRKTAVSVLKRAIQNIDSLLAFSINPKHVFPHKKKRLNAKASSRLKTSLIVTIYECLRL